jgi:hypothetical protein
VAVEQRWVGIGRLRPALPAIALAVVLLLIVGVAAVVLKPAWLGFDEDRNAPIRNMRASPSRLSFDAGRARESLVTLANSGTSAIVFRSVTISGSDRAAFGVDPGTCGDVLHPGQSCDLTVRFVPPHTGTFAADLVVRPDVGPARELPVTGSAAL